MWLAPKKNPRTVILEKDLHLGGQVRDVECQELFENIFLGEDITTLGAPTILENSLEPTRIEKTRFQQSKQINLTSSKAAFVTLSMATYISSWVTFTLSGSSYTLSKASYTLSSSGSSILSSATNILFSTTSTILAWATYTTSFTFIVLLTTFCVATSNPRLSILLTFILLFIFCLKSEWGKRRMFKINF